MTRLRYWRWSRRTLVVNVAIVGLTVLVLVVIGTVRAWS